MTDDELDIQKHAKKLDLFLEQRNLVATTESDTQKSHDQAILTLSSAAIGLSLVLVDKAKPVVFPSSLVVAWALFVVAIIFTLLSFRATIAALQAAADNWDAAIAEIRGNPHPKENPAAKRSAFLSATASWAFVLGVVALLVFSVANFAK